MLVKKSKHSINAALKTLTKQLINNQLKIHTDDYFGFSIA